MRHAATLSLILLPTLAAASQGPGVGQGMAAPGLEVAAACLALGPLIVALLLAARRLVRTGSAGDPQSRS